MLPRTGGIYIIENSVSGKAYVGSAVNIAKRWLAHVNALRGGYHENLKLTNAWMKHGENAFQCRVLEHVADTSLLIAAEQRWLDQLQTYRLGYNMCPTAGNSLGRTFSKESREKMSRSAIGRNHSAETKAKLSAIVKARPREAIERIARLNKGGKRTAETRRRQSEAQRGKKHSDATKARLADLARKMPQEQRDKIAASLRGRKNGPHRPESIAKMSAALRAGWQRRKAAIASAPE